MLHLETVEPHALSVLRTLMDVPELKEFALVGDTALSLLYGHRVSVDLDLFSNKPFDNETIINSLIEKFGISFDNRSTNPRFGVFGFIDNVKIDIVRHPHPQIRPEINSEGIRMFSTEDIIAMPRVKNSGRLRLQRSRCCLTCCDLRICLIFSVRNISQLCSKRSGKAGAFLRHDDAATLEAQPR